MRLEPVDLVAPKPKPPSIPTRRALLIAGGSLLCGLGVGGAGGYATAALLGGPADDGPGRVGPEEPLRSTGDAELDELRRLATRAPMEELAAQWLYFTDAFANAYRGDPVLLRGVKRLCRYVLGSNAGRDRRAIARALTQVIEMADPDVQLALARHLPALREVH